MDQAQKNKKLLTACREGDPEKTKKALDQGANNIVESFLQAAKRGHDKVTDILVTTPTFHMIDKCWVGRVQK